MSQKLSWPIFVNFGRARIGQNLAQIGQDGANLEPRWCQEPPSWGQDGHLEAIWGAFWSIFGGLGSGLWKNVLKIKHEQHFLVLATFAVFEGLVGLGE